MRVLYFFLLFSLVVGQVAAVSLGGGVRVLFLDLVVATLLAGFILGSKKRRAALTFFTQIFGPFIVIGMASLLWQMDRFSAGALGQSSLYLWRFAAYGGAVVVVAFSAQLKKIALPGLWGAGVAIGLLGLVQYFVYPNLRNLSYLGWDPHEYRVFSTLLDPNFTGIILVLTLILSCDLLQKSKHKNVLLHKVVFLASVPVFLALLLTYSRGSYLAFLGACLTWAVLRKQWTTMVAGATIFAVLLLFLPRPGGEGVNLFRTLSVYSRIEDSREALKMYSQSPFFGVGFNTLRFYRNATEITSGTQDVSHSGAGFHNSWLFLLTTTGIVGFAAYIWLWWQLLNKSQRGILPISFAAVAVHSMFDNSLFYPAVMIWLWVVAGSGFKAGRSPSVPV